ncbi:hypothetical protein LAZ67_1007803 [Cordylochernes scorpioides]|uniref:Uncharacterized protein n=1 Tax=Cordylochernes scorpioides TaxID=51811 RepID=A0ABY6K2T4_9ARAC|nr:hypothetical protein LAZ67_1007803 [Cordylochernes scorpioides]
MPAEYSSLVYGHTTSREFLQDGCQQKDHDAKMGWWCCWAVVVVGELSDLLHSGFFVVLVHPVDSLCGNLSTSCRMIAVECCCVVILSTYCGGRPLDSL